MQPPPPTRPERRSQVMMVLVAAVLLVVGGVVGYLVGSADLRQATLRVGVENRLTTDLTAEIFVNGKGRATASIPAGQTVSVDLVVAFAASAGAFFEVEARAQTLLDSDRVLVNAPGIYVVTLALG